MFLPSPLCSLAEWCELADWDPSRCSGARYFWLDFPLDGDRSSFFLGFDLRLDPKNTLKFKFGSSSNFVYLQPVPGNLGLLICRLNGFDACSALAPELSWERANRREWALPTQPEFVTVLPVEDALLLLDGCRWLLIEDMGDRAKRSFAVARVLRFSLREKTWRAAGRLVVSLMKSSQRSETRKALFLDRKRMSSSVPYPR